jgi:hypothetical protein
MDNRDSPMRGKREIRREVLRFMVVWGLSMVV